jgi:hypothetical protein
MEDYYNLSGRLTIDIVAPLTNGVPQLVWGIINPVTYSWHFPCPCRAQTVQQLALMIPATVSASSMELLALAEFAKSEPSQ